MSQWLSVSGSAKFIELLTALVLVLILIFFAPVDAIAHCDGKHTGKHPHCSGNKPGNTNLGDDYTATDGVKFTSPSLVGSFDYHIVGTPASDDIYGGGGTDLIEGGDGGDRIEARGGADEIHSGGGSGLISAGAVY